MGRADGVDLVLASLAVGVRVALELVDGAVYVAAWYLVDGRGLLRIKSDLTT